MTLFDELIGFIKAMGASQIAMVLLLVGVILMLLIFSAIRRGGSKDKSRVRETQRTAPTFEAVSPSQVKSQSQDGFSEPSIKPASKVEAKIKSAATSEVKPVAQPTLSTVPLSAVPQDSILRRHYDALHQAVVVANKSSIVKKPLVVDSYQPIVHVTVSPPEDSVLKRHFIHRLLTEIQLELPPRPSDSILRRHYDNHIRRELAKRLAS